MSPRYDVPKAAPEPLRLVQQFVNSVDYEHGHEWIATPDELRQWLADRELPADGLTARDVTRAHEVREALRRLLVANNEHTTDPEAIELVNRAIARSGLHPELTPQGARLVSPEDGIDAAIGRILAVALDSMREGTWSRLKACRQCHWSFYDYSRNRSATWCSMSICGNRRKTRAYRQRRSGRR
ncbi:MAG: ABATE domain-containing protein [Gaiellaceae bacterium]